MYMENFNTVPDKGTFGGSVEVINQNFMLAQQEMETLRQLYNNLSQSDVVPVTQLPATGEAGKIYRLAGTTSYADYMYAEGALTTPIKMAEYDNAIDDEPTAGSNNLVKSGGVSLSLQFNLKFTEHRFIDSSGNLRVQSSLASYNATEDYYPVVAGMTYNCNLHCAANTNTCIAFYDKNKTFVSYVNVHSTPFVVPDGTVYARFSDFHNDGRDPRWIRPQYNDAKDVERFIIGLVNDLGSDLSDELENILVLAGNASVWHNQIINKYGNIAGGTANYVRTDYLAVTPNTEVYINLSANAPFCYHAFYDENKNFISSVQGVTTMTIPNNACYMRASGYTNNTSLSSVAYKMTISNVYELLMSLNKDLRDSITNEIGSSVVCWGDSLTQGAGSDMTHNLSTVLSAIEQKGIDIFNLSNGCNYPTALQTFLHKKVYEFGVGGENMNAIGCRIGANPLYNTAEIVIPASGTVSFARNILRYIWTEETETFAWQHSAQAYNPCYINGKKCYLDKQDNNTYTLRFDVAQDNAMTVKVNTPIFLKGIDYQNPQIAIIWAGTNGGYTSMADMKDKIDMMIKAINPKNFIVVPRYAWNLQQVESVEEEVKRLQAYYGHNFFNLPQYLKTYALTDFGITPTTDADLTAEQIANGVLSDVYCQANGILPSSLWRWCYGVDGQTRNDLHLNAAGYAILAFKLYEIIKKF